MEYLHRQPKEHTVSLHRPVKMKETRLGRECQFCRSADPDFEKRHAMDKLVGSKEEDRAAAHLTENGYVRHRLFEMMERLGPEGRRQGAA